MKSNFISYFKRCLYSQFLVYFTAVNICGTVIFTGVNVCGTVIFTAVNVCGTVIFT
jgi:hypothetical protein